MSDVREQLAENLAITHAVIHMRRYEVADAILERFDVTPKPVVTSRQLGVMVQIAYKDETYTPDHIGGRMLGQLEAAGLKIVKADQS